MGGGSEVIPEKTEVMEVMRILEEIRISELMGGLEVIRAHRGHTQGSL